MTALPDVPNVLRVVHEGTLDTFPWANISHWRFVTTAGTLTPTQLEAALAKFVNSWRDNIRPVSASQVVDLQVLGFDLTSSTSASSIASDGDAGAGGDGLISPEACVLVSKHVSRRYRGGHPRSYWPGLNSGYSTIDKGRAIDPIDMTSINSHFQAYYADIPPAVTTDGDTNISSFHEVQVSYYHAGALRTVPVVDDITGYTVNEVLATQRRRMHRV